MPAEVIAELRMRVIRLVAQHGVLYEPGGHFGPHIKAVFIDDWIFEIRGTRQIRVGRRNSHWPKMIEKVIYDSDRLSPDYQDTHVIRLIVLPFLRERMILDDLAFI